MTGLSMQHERPFEEGKEHASDDEKKAIEVAIQEAEDALKGGDKEAIDGAAAKLTEVTSPVAQKNVFRSGSGPGCA